MSLKKRISSIIAVFMIVVLVIPMGRITPAHADQTVTGVVKAKELYMRTGAGTDYSKVQAGGRDVVLVSGQEVSVLGEKNGWYHIRAVANGEVVEGYSMSGKDGTVYISVSDSASPTGEYRTGTVTAQELNVRSGPSTSYSIVKVDKKNLVLKKGMTVSVDDVTDGWCHIYTEVSGSKVEGYCLAKYIDIAENGPAEPEYAYGSVTASQLNVRTGPSTSYSVVKVGSDNAVLTSNQKVTILGEKDGWYHITAAYGKSLVDGYCLKTYIKVISGTVPADTEDDDAAGDADSDKKTTGADEESTGDDKTDGESSEAPFSYTDLSNGVPEGYEIVTKQISAKFAIPGIVTAQDGLNMREIDEPNGAIKAVLPADSEITIINITSNKVKDDSGETVVVRWYKVVADVDGEYMTGYVLSDYVEMTDFAGLTAKNNKKGQVIRKKYSKASYVKGADGKNLKLAKNAVVNVIGEATAKDGTKFIEIEVETGGETVTGYVAFTRLNFISTTSYYEVQYLALKVDEPGEDEQTPAQEQPGNTEDGEDDEDDAAESTPETKYSFAGANAVIKDAPGLTVHKAPKNSSEVFYTSDNKAVMLYTGDSVEVIEATSDGSSIWCYVRFYFHGTEYFGYIRSTHIEADESLKLLSSDNFASTQTLDFESQLDREGFPESYKQPLRELHEQYPLWQFKAYHTEVDWNEAVYNESQVGVSLLPNDWSLEWLSFAPGAYSWKNDTFTVFDGSYWVAASENAVRYYMDPRNWLTYSGIFQFETLTYTPSYQTIEGADKILKTTAFGNGAQYTYKDDYGEKRKLTYVDTFAMAAEYSGVSLYHLVSRSKNEIGNGTPSNSVTGTVAGYENLYNFYNIGANDSAIKGQNIINGLTFARNGSKNAELNKMCMISWSNPFRAILGGAYYIGYNYINKGQDTLYFERFNVVGGEYYPNFTHQYMTNVAAPSTEGTSTSRGYQEDAQSLPLVFSIPVYLNMPEQPCGAPEKMYNPNNWLKTLKVLDINGDKHALTPTFDYTEDQEYTLFVDNATDYLKFKTATVSGKATVVSDNVFFPEVGYNRAVIQVMAENGDIREYVINIIREENPEAEPEPTIEPEPTLEPEPTAEPVPEEGPDESGDPIIIILPVVTPEPMATGDPEPGAEE